jgi:hypothetical protein
MNYHLEEQEVCETIVMHAILYTDQIIHWLLKRFFPLRLGVRS